MKFQKIYLTVSLVALLLFTSFAKSSEGTISITVQTDKPGAKISPTMWGIMLEDMNFGIDGGLYAELVKNRSFEFSEPMMGWHKIQFDSTAGTIEVLDQNPFHQANSHYLRLKMDTPVDQFGVYNEGFCGIGVQQGDSYIFSVQARVIKGNPKLRIVLTSDDDQKLAENTIHRFTRDWAKYTVTLHVNETALKATLKITIEGSGTVDIDMVSLFPEKTWKNRTNGLRPDLAKMIADLRPGFVKFPGGFITEGRGFASRYNWKNSIGELGGRLVTISPWNRFSRRPMADCYFSYGMGIFEYFQFCEDIGAEPLPAVNPGMSAQFTQELAPMDQLEPFIQDALDLIEFANGPVSSKWGKLRVQMGHPEPFNMKMIRLGNEQSGPQYIERYEKFAEAIKQKYPTVKLVSGTGPTPAGDNFKFTWDKLCELQTDIVDQHAHKLPYWFFSNANRYDNYDRSGPKVIFGEYAAHSEPGLVNFNNRNNLNCALAEAAFCTGLERNADVVVMSCYAPLLAHTERWQWKPNLIWFDNLNVFATPSYYVQQMFSHNRGDVVQPVKIDAPNLRNTQEGGSIGIGTWATQAEFKDIKITRDDQIVFSCDFTNGTDGWQLLGEGDWKTEDGVLRQNSTSYNVRTIKNINFRMGYTYSLKARKISGAEGFLVFFSMNEKGPLYRWNLGGWGNTRHAFVDVDEILTETPGFIETGKWYDIKIEFKNGKALCYLDNELVQSAELLSGNNQTLYASAVRDNSSGEIILKVVNTVGDMIEVEINLTGQPEIETEAHVITLSGANLDDENLLDNPRNITPLESKFDITTPRFVYSFPKYSFTVLRIKTR